ncbi:MAG: glucose-1-phosphate adenylyltransferase [Polyangiales bacterium]|nr:glucose-1-phosphate adenylyltransferase [Myxococcales bacterium]MCB9656090.1 glucose-1-phosphate adenylyltransferase [Sandaracinaceae bacterium]
MTQNAEHRRLASRSVALVLAGGRGSRLKQLTDRRAKPAVHFGGKYRIVDFALSNCLNSGLRRIYVLTQYKSHSLLRHIQRGWSFLRADVNEFVDLLPAQQRVDESMWYRGTADAVWQNLDILRAEGPEYVVILAGDHIYKMDYAAMLEEHVARGADCSVACVEVPRDQAREFGVMDTDASGRIISFLEKPAEPPCVPGKPEVSLASMGIYVCNAEFLYDSLVRDAKDEGSTHDFGRDFIPSFVSSAKLYAHDFSKSCQRSGNEHGNYWRDVGTLDAYWEASLDLTSVTPELDLYDPNWRIFTHSSQLAPAKFVFDDAGRRGTAMDSVVSEGVIVSGAEVRRSLLSTQARVNSYASLQQAVILPEVNIGRHARLNKVIVDRGVNIPEGLVVGEDPVLDAQRFERTPGGVCLISAEMIAALG